MAKQPIVGLGEDINFDPSLQTDEVDHDFFDNPAPLSFELVIEQTTNVEQVAQSSQVNSSPFRRLDSDDTNNIFSESTEEQLAQLPTVTTDQQSSSNSIFSTETLLACLANSQNELNIDLNDVDGQYNSANSHHHRQHQSNESSPNIHKKKRAKCSETRIKLFDLSSSSSSEDDSQESDEELNNFIEKYHDFLDVGDSDLSDITEVSPMSSLAVSPFCGLDHNSDDSNSTSANLLSICQQNQHMNSSSTEFCQPDSLPVIKSTTNLLKPTPIKMISAEDLPTKTSFIGVFDVESKDQNQNGERSPSNSSVVSSACGSANSAHNTCSSSLSFSLSSSTTSPKSRRSGRSGCSSSASSSTSSFMGRSKTVKNHSFTPDQLKRIERENGILLKKILDTQRHHHHNHHHHHHTGGVRGSRNGTQARSLTQCSATISRQKQQRRIDYENSLLMKRLQTVKPCKEIEEAFKSNNNV